MRGFLLNRQNPLSVTKIICRRYLSGWLLSREFKVYLGEFIPLQRCKSLMQYQDAVCLGTQKAHLTG